MANWILAYNTNGFAHHRLDQAIVLLSELDYKGVAITLDVHHLDPFASEHKAELGAIRSLLDDKRMECIVESGARFNLDFRRKHYPSLLSQSRATRVDFLRRCIEAAHELRAQTVSFWSGHNFEDLEDEEAWALLVEGVGLVLDDSEAAGIDLAFEPEPGMFVETLAGYERLKSSFPDRRLGLALDVGHLVVTGECDIGDAIRRHRGDLYTVAVEDMRRGIHEHLPFGEGDIHFQPVFQALNDIGYRGFITAELSRSSSDAPRIAAESMLFLERF